MSRWVCLLLLCSEVRWSQVEQEVSHTNLVPFLQKFVITFVVCYICTMSAAHRYTGNPLGARFTEKNLRKNLC